MSSIVQKIFSLTTVAIFVCMSTSFMGCDMLEDDEKSFCEKACEKMDECEGLDEDESVDDCIDDCDRMEDDIPSACKDCFDEDDCEDVYVCFMSECEGE